MGLLRYFLAIAVLLAHTPIVDWQYKPFDGNGAIPVQVFFVISGFYMSLIFEKYELQSLTLSHLKNFYVARALRIYPVYFVCLGLMVIFLFNNITPPQPFHFPDEAMDSIKTLPSKLFYLFENLFIFGQSFMRFCIFDTGTGSFYLDPMNSPTVPGPMGDGFTIMGQAWTLSLELTFYLLVPFLLRRSAKFILTLCALSFLLRVTLFQIGYNNYNIENSFFPTALGVFLLGALSHRLIYPLVRNKSPIHLKLAGFAILSFILIFAMYFYHRIDNFQLKFWGFIFFIALALPYLFCCFRLSAWDRYIGEFSYPIYMSHFLGIALALKFCNPQYIGYYVALFANVISIVLLLFIVKPLDKLRHQRLIKIQSKGRAYEPEISYAR